jgi:hypothetical protein
MNGLNGEPPHRDAVPGPARHRVRNVNRRHVWSMILIDGRVEKIGGNLPWNR